ncbi:MAG: hypothetical protein RI988_1529 [Pseudomonadota bacterium]|jgi:hypothetical protein
MNATSKAAAFSARPPLTHHEILALVEPFVRAGAVPDMAASDRTARRIVLRAREVVAEGLGEPGLRLVESWEIEVPEPGEVRVLRRLAWPDGPCAELEGECREGELDALREAMQAVTAQRQFVRVEQGEGTTEPGPAAAALHAVGALVQRVRRTPSDRRASPRLGDSAQPEPARSLAPELVLRRAEALVGGLALRLSLSGVGGYPAEVELLRGEGAAGSPRLPEDLLAVLGRAWEPLTELNRGWVARVAIRGEEPRRSREARAVFARTLAHLATTLAEPPERFHARHRAARWGVVLRGTTPWLVGVAVVGVALWARQSGGSSVLALLANVAPPLLMGLVFIRREMPRLALPSWPRPPGAQDWQPELARPVPHARAATGAAPPTAPPTAPHTSPPTPLQEAA